MSEPEQTAAATNPPPERSPGARLAARPAFISVALALITLAVFWRVATCDFVNFDDPDYYTLNPHVQQGLTGHGVGWALTTGRGGNWHPLTWISHMLDAELFGPKPAGPHLVNVLFHAANTVLLFLVLRKLTSAHWRSAFAAALFALHPLHVESVAWVAERKDVLSASFGLLSLLAYAGYAREAEDGERKTESRGLTSVFRPLASGRYGLALLSFALGLMSKPMLVTLPFVLLLLDYWPLRRCEPSTFNPQPATAWRLVREKIPFFALSAVFCVVTFLVQQKAGAVNPLDHLSISARLGNAVVSYARYLGKTFWPAGLAVPYPHPGHWPVLPVVMAAVLVAVLCIAALWFGRRQRFVFTGWFWFLGTLVPVIGLVQVGHQSLADRYTYVPLIGIFILLSWGAAAAWAHWRLPKAAAGVAAGLILGACALRTIDQLGHWRNSETLFRHTIAVAPDSGFAHDNLACHLFGRGEMQEAVNHYLEALRINPRDAIAYDGLACCWLNQGRLEEAIANYRHSLELNPAQPATLFNLGSALAMQSRYDEAIEVYRAALRLKPDEPDTHHSLGNVFLRQGKFTEAIECYRAALRLKPDYPGTHSSLGLALAALGRNTEAMDAFAEAVRLAPEDAEARFGLGHILGQLGRREEAMAQLREVLRLKPDHAGARNELQARETAGPGEPDPAVGR